MDLVPQAAGDEPLNETERLRSSARGWHGVQLAVLGFIGLCGVLQGDSGADQPRWLEVTAGLLVLASLVVACVATALVAAVAWPVGRERVDAAGAHGAEARLRAGIWMTYVAVVVLALAATSSWWPHVEAGAPTEVRTEAGSVCGTITGGAAAGTIALVVEGQRVVVQTRAVQSLEPVASCE